MEVQLQELVDKIKKDGVAAADEKAAEIIRDLTLQLQFLLKICSLYHI